MTWKDVKLATLQKMFAAEGSTIPVDDSTTDYIASMPQAANEALQRLSTAGKFIIKKLSIAHNPLDNLVQDISIVKLGEYTVTAEGARAYYFEFSGKGVLTITVDGVSTQENLESKGTYTAYKGLISAGTNVTLILSCTYPSTVKSLALYAESFDDASEIPAYGPEVRYDLKELVDDFYQLSDTQLFYEGEYSSYFQINDYFRENASVLVLHRNQPGNYTIYYRAYPDTITLDTDDNYELPLDKEVAVLLPLYMASELYKDDDVAIATTYRNEFEVALESLRNSGSVGKEEFTSESGWI